MNGTLGRIVILFDCDDERDDYQTFVSTVYVYDNGTPFETYAHTAAVALSNSIRNNYKATADFPPSAMDKAKEFAADLRAHGGIPDGYRDRMVS